ncbi:MAG TPA: hypothetical protein VHX37_15015 [Acidobacteriaceae bacterium]|jgi:hypothetical protein|nr:hypothetical protein [Acidobacteriaceae bacterium]
MRTYPALLLLLLVPAPVAIAAQTPTLASTAPRIVYTFQHPQLQPSRYSISVDENGRGRFVSQPGVASPDDDIAPTATDRPVQLDATLTTDLFRYARSHNFFATRCGNDQGKLAFTGNKTLAYTGPDGRGSCSFVWAEDPVLQRFSDQLGAAAFTLEIGRRLSLEVLHDRLGLDAELESLQDAVKDHRAGDVANIADQLQTIAGDEQVMNRARKRALALLSSCESAPKRNE